MKVNKESKLVLDKLWKMAKKRKGYIKLNNNKTYMPLSVEILPDSQISLCHYGEQNGDLMRDPEMVFWKDQNKDYFPIYFRNDYAGFEDFTAEIKENKLFCYNEERQSGQVEFANIWMKNIQYQQNIKVSNDGLFRMLITAFYKAVKPIMEATKWLKNYLNRKKKQPR